MMLLRPSNQRDGRSNVLLGGTTAFAAGLVNVCSVMAFFAFSSNVTGHVAIFAEEIVKGHWHQVSVVLVWLLLFLLGSFTANLLVNTLAPRNVYVGHAIPLVLEVVLLTGVAYYGHHDYRETLTETEYLLGFLLFAMGLQNGMVATVSHLVVKTTHLTGLMTDLGMELSMVMQPRFRDDLALRFKLALHLVILFAYVTGGLIGGWLYMRHDFQAMYVASLLLGLILVYDLIVLWQTRRSRSFSLGLEKRADPSR